MLPIERTRTASRLPVQEGSSPPRRIALLTTYYWPEVGRGTERIVHDLASGLVGADWSPVIVTSHDDPTSRTDEEGVEVLRARRLSGRVPRLFGYTEQVGHLPRMWRELRGESYPVIHAFGAYEAAVADLASRKHRSASVLTVTGIPQRAVIQGRLWRRRALRRAVAASDAVVVFSEAARDALGWLGGDQRVIYPGVDLAAFGRSRERATSPTILCTAAIDDPRKRVDLVIEAFREVRRRRPDARLILSRRGARPDDGHHREPGIEHRDVHAHDELVSAYSEAWVTVLASRAEAFGLVAVESLACGTPVVVSDDAGTVEAVGGPGLHARMFSGDRPADLARALLEALERAKDSAVERACRTQAGNFSLERFLDEHERLYAELAPG
jgi:glycosyltransferase involved in cell wall biosynthesis